MDVTADDLTKPLGLDAPADRFRRWRVPVAPILAGLIVALLGGFAAYVLVVDDPLAGEPHAIVAIEQPGPPPLPAAPAVASPGLAPVAEAPRRSAAEVEDASGVSVVRPSGSAAPGAVIIRVPEPETESSRRLPTPASSNGAGTGSCRRLVRTAPSPGAVYARPAVPPTGGARPGAKIALLVSGPRHQPERHGRRHRPPSGRRDPRLRALRRRSRQDRGGGAERGPRGHAPGADGAVRLSGQRSRAAHADDPGEAAGEPRQAALGARRDSRAISASSTSWAPG